MPRKPISFELDFMIKDIFPRFTVKQFDDVSFNIKPKNQGLDYNTTGMIGKIFVGVNNDMFMQTTGITVSNNNINILLDKNMLQKSGRAYAEVELTDNAGTITSSSFIFDIDPKIGEGGQIPGEYEGFVEKYERLISEFKSQVNSTINNCNDKVNITINNCNTNVDNKLNSVDSLVNVKISDFEKRFNRLTSSQQQDAEVIDARVDFKGVAFDSLKDRIDYTDKLLRDSTVSTVTTESDFTTVEATSGGYFEDVKLEGKTLVNLCPEIKSRYNNCNLETSKGFTIISKCLLSDWSDRLLVKVIKTDDSVAYLRMLSDGTNDTVHYLKDVKRIEQVYFDPIAPSDFSKFKVIILEGDHRQNPPSYFEGLKSVGQSATTSEDGVGEIVVSSVKGDGNLFDGKYFEKYTINADGGVSFDDGVGNVTDFIRVLPNTTYSFTGMISNANTVAFYDINKKIISRDFWSPKTTPSNCYYIRVKYDTSLGGLFSVYIGNKEKPYTPHQSDKKRLLYYNNETQAWEKPILRQWDSIEKHADGKYYYHQRSGEKVLNGSESSWILDNSATYNENTLFFATKDSGLNVIDKAFCVSDRFLYSDCYSSNADKEGIYVTKTGYRIRINKSKLSTQDVQGFKQWLQANNVTVVYQLAQEKVYECTNIDLITYNGETNYIVESGAIVPKTTLKVHNNISNVVSLLQKKVSLLESNIKASQEVQDMMILETDMRMLDIELALMDFMPMTLNLGGSDMLRSATYFNFLKNHIVNETYEKEYLENVMNKYLATGRINQDEYNELYKMLYPPVYDIELPIEY